MRFLRKIIVKLKSNWRKSWYDMTGDIDRKRYPSWFFHNAIRLDFSTAIRSQNVMIQNFTVIPRHWFIDAWFRCERCEEEFCWTAQEQKVWFEEYKLKTDSVPHACRSCRKILRNRLALRKQYDAEIEKCLKTETSVEAKKKMIEAIDQMEILSDNELPENIQLNRRRLVNQLKKTPNLNPNPTEEK